MTRRTLHASNATPFGRQVRIVLDELALPFERDTTGAQQRPPEAFAALNPGLRVPVLVDGERVLFETRIILEYLLETYPVPPEGPQPPLDPAVVRPAQRWDDALLVATLDNVLESAVNLRQLRISGVEVERSSYLQRHLERIRTSLAWLDAQASGEGFRPGRFCVPDIALIAALDFGERFDVFPWRGHTRLEALIARFAGRPSVRSTLPEG